MTLIASGTITADGTEQTIAAIAAPSVPKWYVTKLSLVGFTGVGGAESVELRQYTKMDGSTYELADYGGPFVWDSTFGTSSGIQPRSVPVPVAGDGTQQYKSTLKQLAGTNRTYRYEVYEF